jgi:DNA-3-methyladenine glycosylase
MSITKILKQDFFDRPVLQVAPDLIGKFLVRKLGRREISHMITEVEAYDGEKDRACHASRGKTARTEVMYGEAGHFYIYLCYGIHEMLNVVTGPIGYPSAVLIRGVEGVDGPGKVTKLFYVDRGLNGETSDRKTGLWFEDRGVSVPRQKTKKMPRVGVAYAGEWAKKRWRFVLSK